MNIYFDYFAGILTIIGFALSMTDVLKQFTPLKVALKNIAFGFFLGAIFGTFFSAKFNIDMSGYGVLGAILLFALTGLCGAAVVAGYFSVLHPNSDRRAEGVRLTWVLLAFALMVKFWLGDMTNDSSRAAKFSIDEKVAVAKWDLSRGDDGRAVTMLNNAIGDLAIQDPRRKALNKLIGNIRQEEADSYLK